MDLTSIPTFAGDGLFHVIVETPRGSTLKLKYESRWQAMGVSRPLPYGLMFPFDWGFIPSTRADDGDPLDAMLLWEVASYPGVVVACRAIAVLQVEQNKVDFDPSERVRNDRIMAIPVQARREHSIVEVTALPGRVREELGQFAVAATALEGKDVRIIGWGDAITALRLVQESSERNRVRRARRVTARTGGLE